MLADDMYFFFSEDIFCFSDQILLKCKWIFAFWESSFFKIELTWNALWNSLLLFLKKIFKKNTSDIVFKNIKIRVVFKDIILPSSLWNATKNIDMNFPIYCRVTFVQTMTLEVKIPLHRGGVRHNLQLK